MNTEKTKQVEEKKWMDGYKDIKLMYVNYKYHKDVCSKSLERLKEIEELKAKATIDDQRFNELMVKANAAFTSRAELEIKVEKLELLLIKTLNVAEDGSYMPELYDNLTKVSKEIENIVLTQPPKDKG